MTLVSCDIGNSRCKIAWYINGTFTDPIAFSTLDFIKASQSILSSSPTPEHVFVSSVVPNLNNKVLEVFSEIWNCPVTFIKTNPLPFPNHYKAGAQTGIDRLANVAGALAQFFPPFIIADIGSAVNTEIVDPKGAFVGGNIFPGINLQMSSLFKNTANLPYISPLNSTPYWGTDTHEAIFSGICLNISGALEKLVGYFEKEWNVENIQLILTGGDSALISSFLEIPHITDLKLTLKGVRELGLFQQSYK